MKSCYHFVGRVLWINVIYMKTLGKRYIYENVLSVDKTFNAKTVF